jgi:hypothetical protein
VLDADARGKGRRPLLLQNVEGLRVLRVDLGLRFSEIADIFNERKWYGDGVTVVKASTIQKFCNTLQFRRAAPQNSRKMASASSPARVQRRTSDTRAHYAPFVLPLQLKRASKQIRFISEHLPRQGVVLTMGRMKVTGVAVSHKAVRGLLKDANGGNAGMRRQRAVKRRQYNVPYPMILVHSDGCHHLVKYGIVLHGCIDGYSRKILYMAFANNNRAETVGELHRAMLVEYGVPTLHRTDHGGENVEIWQMLRYMRQLGYRCSDIQGPSTGNQWVPQKRKMR